MLAARVENPNKLVTVTEDEMYHDCSERVSSSSLIEILTVSNSTPIGYTSAGTIQNASSAVINLTFQLRNTSTKNITVLCQSFTQNASSAFSSNLMRINAQSSETLRFMLYSTGSTMLNVRVLGC